MSQQVQVTRKSIVGFGYTSAVENDERGNLRVCATERPDHVGTISQVMQSISSDRTLRSFDSGGTYYSSAWFVKVAGEWHKINTSESRSSAYLPQDLLKAAHPEDGRKYHLDSVLVEIE